METIAWVAISQSIFAAILIGSKKEKNISDRILTGWLSLLAIEFFTCIIDYRVHGNPLLSNSFLLFNPALFLYVKSLTKAGFKLKFIQILHLLPFMIFETASYLFKEIVSLNHLSVDDKYFTYRIIFALASVISWIFYNTGSYVLVHNHRINLENEFSNLEKNKTLGWILFIVIFYAVYSFAVFFSLMYSIIYEINFTLSDFVSYSALLLLVYILGYYGLMQKKIFEKRNEINDENSKYKNSNLNINKKKKIKLLIINLFESEKPYLNSDFNMDSLSSKINVPKHQITEVLNTEIGKNFFQFVNFYRVEDVKKMLLDKKNNYSIEAIGYECGFNSKSSFFTVFKKITEKTPLQYKNSE